MEDLTTTLIDIYEILRYQQDILAQSAVRVHAVTTVLMHFEQLAELYPKVLDEVQSGTIAQQAASMLGAIELKLQALRAEGGKFGLVQ